MEIKRKEERTLAHFTKKAIIVTFLELLNKYSLDKITVKDIVDTCGVNRNTFYYYYKDIYDLIDDVFAIEINRVINDETHYDTFYDELHRVALLAVENKTAIAHIYYSKSRDVLDNYLFTISKNLVKNFARSEIDRQQLIDTDIEFVCDFYAHSLVGIILDWIKGSSQTDSVEFLKKIAVVLESTLPVALRDTSVCDKV